MDKQQAMIHIYICTNDISIDELLYGIEEEGVPYKVKDCQAYDALELGMSAATDSNLEIGIGITNDEIIVNHQKRKTYEPIYSISRADFYDLRLIGNNAARLVKGMPLKQVN